MVPFALHGLDIGFIKLQFIWKTIKVKNKLCSSLLQNNITNKQSLIFS